MEPERSRRRLALAAALGFAASCAVTFGCVRVHRAVASGMEPLVRPGAALVSCRCLPAPDRGSVVVARDAAAGEFVGRLAALGGDRIERRSGAVRVNGSLAAPHLAAPGSGSDFGPVRVPDGHAFLVVDRPLAIGDDPGPVALGSVAGRVVLVIDREPGGRLRWARP